MHEGRPLPGGPSLDLRLEVRRYVERDRAALLEFRRDHYGEGAVQADPAYVDWQFREAPQIAEHGAPLHVAKLGDRIVGTQGTMRTSLSASGRTIPAAWVIDFAVRKDLRRSGIGEAIGAVSRNEGLTRLIVEASDAAHAIAARAGYAQLGEVPLFVRPLDPVRWARSRGVPRALAGMAKAFSPAFAVLEWAASRSARREGVELVETMTFDERADALFAALSAHYPVLCARDRNWLHWRFERYPRPGRYRLHWLMRGGEPAGYAVLRMGAHHGLPAGVLADYLCAPELVPALLTLCLRRFRAWGAEVATCLHLNVRADRAFRGLGFFRRNSGWRFLVRPGKAGLAPEILEPRNWFLTGGDSNVDRERSPGATTGTGP